MKSNPYWHIARQLQVVKWKGYTYEESTWEPASNFKPHTLRDYHAKRKRDKEEDSGSDSSDDDHKA